jgi:hypothetical protein
MVKHDITFKDYCLKTGKAVFGVNTLSAFFKTMDDFIKLLGMPTKFTDFDQIKNVTKADIDFLNQHFNKGMKNKTELAKHVFDTIKK